VEGLLVERGMPAPAHGSLQFIVAEHLGKYRRDFAYSVILECRVEIVKRPRYRIPDVLLCAAPVPRTRTLETVPFAVIEILSPDDRTSQQLARFREYWDRGVRQIVVLDPEELTAFRYHAGSLIAGPVRDIELPDGRKVPFPADELFEQLRRELEP
jgi:Uma2 family endonuclease